MGNLEEEILHLREIEEKVAIELVKAQESVDQMEAEYRETQQYMAEHRNEGDAKEMFQSEMMLHQMDSLEGSLVVFLEKMKKTKETPYFARIDFREKDEEESVPYYIGMSAFRFQRQLLIVDWRAPVANMFYDYELGPALYEAPKGRVEGELVLKRQLKIKNGHLEFMFDSSENIQDDILQQELAHTSDEKMKSIISTIQKEQNKIIRNEKTHTLIIQGVAGSGKTSIALHRVAFLLYRFRNQIKAQNVTIISPNKVFGDYISSVLPELGEEPIFEASLEDLALIQIENGVDFVGDRNPLENEDLDWEKRTRYKSTAEFVKQMDAYIAELPSLAFQAEDYVFEEFCVPGDWIQARVNVYTRYPILKRLEAVADDVYNKIDSDNIRREAMPNRHRIFQRLKKMLKLKSTLAAYRDFYKRIGQPKMFKLFQKDVLEWNDVFPFLYLQSYFTGLQVSHLIKHLVVDEMQDYSPIQYAVINRLFQCPKTILGDFSQSVNPNCDYSLEELHELYEGSELVRLEKSYRSTYEIIHFAKAIGNQHDFEAMERHGDRPLVLSFEREEEELERICREVEEFHKGNYNALGIITRTNPEAQAFYGKLRERGAQVNLIMPDSKSFQNGASVMSIQMSKGLEFDEVLLPGVSKENYKEEFDKNLLYVACTRAMHKLIVTCTGQPSGLLPVLDGEGNLL